MYRGIYCKSKTMVDLHCQDNYRKVISREVCDENGIIYRPTLFKKWKISYALKNMIHLLHSHILQDIK